MNREEQMTFANAHFERFSRTTKRARFLAEMDEIVPWSRLCSLSEPHYPTGEGRTTAGPVGTNAPPEGGLVPYPGGPHSWIRYNATRYRGPKIPRTKEAIRALSFGKVQAIVDRFAALNPYDRAAVPGSIPQDRSCEPRRTPSLHHYEMT